MVRQDREVRELRREVGHMISINQAALVSWRDQLLCQVDRVERLLDMSPRTAEMRRWYREQQEIKRRTATLGEGS